MTSTDRVRTPIRRAVQSRPEPIQLSTAHARPRQGTVVGTAPAPPSAPLRRCESPWIDETSVAELAPGEVSAELARLVWCEDGAAPEADGAPEAAARRRVRYHSLIQVVLPQTTTASPP